MTQAVFFLFDQIKSHYLDSQQGSPISKIRNSKQLFLSSCSTDFLQMLVHDVQIIRKHCLYWYKDKLLSYIYVYVEKVS